MAADKIFDEIYFARAGEEYLQNLRIYENTHPPLTKLLVTLSMMLFGGMPHGTVSAGGTVSMRSSATCRTATIRTAGASSTSSSARWS